MRHLVYSISLYYALFTSAGGDTYHSKALAVVTAFDYYALEQGEVIMFPADCYGCLGFDGQGASDSYVSYGPLLASNITQRKQYTRQPYHRHDE